MPLYSTICSYFDYFLEKITLKERTLKIIALLLAIFGFVFFISTVCLSGSSQQDQLIQNEDVCSSPSCIKTASRLLANMDPSVDPCDDFYKFSCGGFLNTTIIPEDESSVTAFTSIKKLVYDQIRVVLKENGTAEDIRPFKLARQYYNLCMDTSAIENDNLTTMFQIFNDLGGWPVLESNWTEGKFDWREDIYNLKKMGFSGDYFAKVGVVEGSDNTTDVVYLDQGSIELPKLIFMVGMESIYVQNHLKFILDAVKLFGGDGASVQQQIEDLIQLEMKIANISLSISGQQTGKWIYTTLDKLQINYPKGYWREYIKRILDIPNFKITEVNEVVIKAPDYFSKITDLLNQTSKRTLANYILWRVLSESMFYLTNSLRNLKLHYLEKLFGVDLEHSRWSYCMRSTIKSFWSSTRTLYDRKHFSGKTKHMTNEILNNVEQHFDKLIQEAEWMDEVTKTKALEKASTIKLYVNSFETPSDESLIEYYSSLKFDPQHFLRAALSISVFNHHQTFLTMNEPPSDEDTFKDISMEFGLLTPGGIFQEVFFNEEHPQYMNFGGIGHMMGHLVSHGFDSSGRKTDKNNELSDWWNNQTEKSYLSRSTCFVEQYSKYFVEESEQYMLGENSAKENIADTGGLKVAYMAYKTWTEENGPEPRLPGLRFNPQQLFWISAANVYCAKYTPARMILNVLISKVAPSKFRVIGPMSNIEDFSRDFNCPAGSRMNPQDKCVVW